MEKIKLYFIRSLDWVFNQYFWLLKYIQQGEFRKKHIHISKEGGQVKIVVQDHQNFVAEIQKKINEYKDKEDERDFIEYALEQALEGCAYIIFIKGKRAVPFWVKKNRLNSEFALYKGSRKERFYFSQLGLLADMDFVRDSFVPNLMPTITGIRPNHTYGVEEGDKVKIITAYFEKMSGLAGQYTRRMFDEIYKEKKGEIRVEVG